MRLYRRGKIYWFALEFEGSRYQKSTMERSRVRAEGIASAFRTALAEHRVGISERKTAPMFHDAMKAFLAWSKEEHNEHPRTFQRYRTSSKPLLAYLKFKNKPIDELTPANVEDYNANRAKQVGKRTQRPIMPATINRELACLKAMYFHAVKDRGEFKNPVSEVGFLPENSEQDRVLTFEEQRKYLAAAAPNLKDIATLILETGMRPEEIYRIQAKFVDQHQGYVLNPYGKTKAARRRIPLNSVALAILKRRLQNPQGSPYLFPHRKDKSKPMLKVNNAHTAALAKSKVDHFRLYDLRHTWATRAAEAGMDMPTLASLLGHSKLNMVMRYAHPQERHQVDAVRLLEASNAAKEIAEFERKNPARETPATVSATVANEQGDLSSEELEDKSNTVN
jgi:integrase